jgi:histidyl-tRNA synthetase
MSKLHAESIMNKVVPSVKGTRDFYPEEMAMRSWLYATVKKASELFGYQEWDAPFLESIDLYAAKSGEELVKEQSYVFQDRGGDLIALRPELTPSLARLIANKQNELTFPARWWSWGPFWRYERPQKGRLREFFQWNVDMLGAASPEADAEVVAVLATFFKFTGLLPQDVQIYVNDRRLLDRQLENNGINKDQFPGISTWIDRREKVDGDTWKGIGIEKGLSDDQIQKISQTLDDYDLWKESSDLRKFFDTIDTLGVSDYVTYNPGIVRGLLYYTGIVFEAWDVGGDIKRSINGGGRYDNLCADVGGSPLTGTGFAMGDVVISLLLEKHGLIPPDLSSSPASVLVTVFADEYMKESMKLASDLREDGINTISYPENAKLPKQFKYADRLKIKIVLVLGPDEIASKKVAIKELSTGQQLIVPRDALVPEIRKILEAH